METLIAEGIGKSYKGRQVVRGVNLKISRGEVVGLLGPNGAGKTTSFYMIVGLVAPETGRIHGGRQRYYPAADVPAGAELRHQLPAAGAVGFPQADGGGKHSGGAGGAGSGHARAEIADRASDCPVEPGHIRSTRGYALSGGERRRVEIARSLCIQPNFILLDEPFSGIDPIAVLELQKIIFDLKASGIGILITDHNVRETLSVTDRAYIIAEGRIFRAGTPHELGNDVEVRRIYLGEGFSLN